MSEESHIGSDSYIPPYGWDAFGVHLSMTFRFSFLPRELNSCTSKLPSKASQRARSGDDQKIYFETT